MARIPTINAQNITPPPGTAGGVLLNNPGTSNVQVKTPLTQQMNPADFGMEGRAIAQGAQDILNNALIPRMRRDAANKRFTEYSDTVYEINGEVDAFALDIKNGNIEIDQYNRPRDINKEIETSTMNWLGRINQGISDPRYRGAAKTQFAQKVATMQLSAANRLTKISDGKAEQSYLKSGYRLTENFQLPTKQSTALGDVITYQNWDIPLTELDTLDNTLENTLLLGTKKLELRDATRLRIFNELVDKLKLTDPQLGMDFVQSPQVEKLLENTSLGEKAKSDAFKAFQDTIKEKWAYDKSLGEQEDIRSAAVSEKLVDDNHIFIYETFAAGDNPQATPLYLMTNWRKHYKNADRMDEFNELMDFAKAVHPQAGVTDPKELFKINLDIFMERGNMNDAMNNPKINFGDRKALIATFKNHKKGDWLVKNNKFKNAKDSLNKLINIPATNEDQHTRQMASVALDKWMQTVDMAITKGPEWTEKNINWMDLSNDLMTEFGSLHKGYDNDQTQKYLKNMHDDLPPSLQNLSFPDAKGGTLYDFERMEVEGHRLLSQGKLKGQQARDVANALKRYRNIITPERLKKEREQLGLRDQSKSDFKTKYFKFLKPPESKSASLQVSEERTPMSTMTDPKLTGPSTKTKPTTPARPLPVPPTQEQTEMFPEMAPASQADPDAFDLATMADEDLNVIQNIIIDLAEGKMISHLRDYNKGVITNYGIAQKLWEEAPEDLKKNPSDEKLKQLFDQYKIPYKAQ